jgi:hypothetical protein
MPATTSRRPVYVPSGRFSPADVLIWVVILGGFGLALGAGLAWLVSMNGYAPGWVWILPATFVCGLAQQAVAWSHCRNRAAGVALGLLVGVVTAAGMYHIDQCSRWGVDWERLDRLPGYVTFRMETDTWWAQDQRMPLIRPEPAQVGVDPWVAPRVNWNWHWATFLGELAVLVLMPAGFARARAGRPFSERRGEWFARDTLTLTPGSAAGLRVALDTGALAEWAAGGVEKTLTHESHVVASVWYCPRTDAGTEAESEVYLSVGSGPLILLEPEEAAALTEVIPALSDLAVPETAKFRSPAEAGAGDPAAAQLIRLDGPHVGRAKTPGVRWRGKALIWWLNLLPWLLFAAFAGSVYLGHLLLEWLGQPDDWLIAYLAVGGISLLLFVKRWYGPGGGAPFARLIGYYWKVVRDQAAQRPDPLFDPEDERVVYAEFAPRRAWSDLSGRRLECEAGLLLIDSERDALLYEGDRSRYVVPAAAIVRCDLEEVTRMGTTDGLYAVVLVVRLAGGDTHELPLVPLGGLDGATPWDRASFLHGVIWELLNGVGLQAGEGEPGA